MLVFRLRAVVLAGVCTILATAWILGRSPEISAKENTAVTETVISGALTTQNQDISLEELKLLLKPLTKEELESEAAAWLSLLKVKVKEISQGEISLLNNSQRANTQNKKSTQIITSEQEVTQLYNEQTLIIDRFNIVLDEWQKKGGDVKYYQEYINTVKVIDFNLGDVLGVELIFSWLKSPEGGVRWAGNLVKFIGIFTVVAIVSLGVGEVFDKILIKFNSVSELLRIFLVITIKRGGFVVGFLLALTAFDISIGPILALVGGVSFVLAFALQNNLDNLASGLMIMLYKPFDVGHEVQLQGIWGFVESITLANTIIKTDNNQTIIIPNGSVWGGMITNNTVGGTRRIDLPVRVSFDQSIPKVEQLLIEIVKTHPKVLAEPKPKTKVQTFGDSFVEVKIRPWVKPSDYRKVSSDLLRTIKQQFDQEGISIPYPQYDLHLQDVSSTPNQDLPGEAS